MAAHWPHVGPGASQVERDFARAWLATPKVVFSSTLESVAWNSRLVRGGDDAVEAEVRRLKAGDGPEMEVGGAALAASMTRMGLIDEYRLFVHPVIVGGGTPYLPPLPDRVPLRLAESRTFGSGVVYLGYRRD
jgi:dihydrofolate reductase